MLPSLKWQHPFSAGTPSEQLARMNHAFAAKRRVDAVDANHSSAFYSIFGREEERPSHPQGSLVESVPFEASFGKPSDEIAVASLPASHPARLGKKQTVVPTPSTDVGDLVEGRQIDAARSYAASVTRRPEFYDAAGIAARKTHRAIIREETTRDVEAMWAEQAFNRQQDEAERIADMETGLNAPLGGGGWGVSERSASPRLGSLRSHHSPSPRSTANRRGSPISRSAGRPQDGYPSHLRADVPGGQGRESRQERSPGQQMEFRRPPEIYPPEHSSSAHWGSDVAQPAPERGGWEEGEKPRTPLITPLNLSKLEEGEESLAARISRRRQDSARRRLADSPRGREEHRPASRGNSAASRGDGAAAQLPSPGQLPPPQPRGDFPRGPSPLRGPTPATCCEMSSEQAAAQRGWSPPRAIGSASLQREETPSRSSGGRLASQHSPQHPSPRRQSPRHQSPRHQSPRHQSPRHQSPRIIVRHPASRQSSPRGAHTAMAAATGPPTTNVPSPAAVPFNIPAVKLRPREVNAKPQTYHVAQR